MRILGVDPGSRNLGFAVIETDGSRLKYIRSGTIKFNSEDSLIERLGQIYESGNLLIEEFDPDEIAIEALIFVKSVVSLRKLAESRGAFLAAFSSKKKYQKKIFEYAPNLIKSTVSGFGHADKESVEKSLSLIFGKINHKSSDDSDALAIAVTHGLLRKKDDRVYRRNSAI